MIMMWNKINKKLSKTIDFSCAHWLNGQLNLIAKYIKYSLAKIETKKMFNFLSNEKKIVILLVKIIKNGFSKVISDHIERMAMVVVVLIIIRKEKKRNWIICPKWIDLGIQNHF